MKKLRAADWVLKTVAVGSPNPAPFPGKYPTRIAWAVSFHGREAKTYVGKPSRSAVNALGKWVSKQDFDIGVVVEFDRRNVIRDVHFQGPVRATDRLNRNPFLMRLYHPWTAPFNNFAVFHDFVFKRIGKRQVYVPKGILNKDGLLSVKKHIEPYKLNLRRHNLL